MHSTIVIASGILHRLFWHWGQIFDVFSIQDGHFSFQKGFCSLQSYPGENLGVMILNHRLFVFKMLLIIIIIINDVLSVKSMIIIIINIIIVIIMYYLL